MHGKTAITYYSTIVCVAIFFTTMFIFTAGIHLLFYIVAGAIFLLSFILILNNLLPEAWYTGIIFGLAILAVHIVIGLWPLTLLMVGVTLLFLFVYYYLQAEKWSKFMLASIVVLFFVSILFIDFTTPPPDIFDEDIQATVEEMEDHEQVEKASVGLEDGLGDEETIYCALRVTDSVAQEEKKFLGEICAKTLSTKVSERDDLRKPNEKDLGELYESYILEISISTDDREEDVLFQRKYTTTKDLEW